MKGHFIRENKFGGYIQSLEQIYFVQYSQWIPFWYPYLTKGFRQACAQFCLFINSKATWNSKMGNESVPEKYCRKSIGSGSGSDTLVSQPNSATCLFEWIYARFFIFLSLSFSFIQGSVVWIKHYIEKHL